MEQGTQDLISALKEKQTDQHNVIEEAIRDQAEGYTVFSVPGGTIYRLSAAKIKNARKIDYLGEAKLIAVTDANMEPSKLSGLQVWKLRRYFISN
jgi:hypothetical protein